MILMIIAGILGVAVLGGVIGMIAEIGFWRVAAMLLLTTATLAFYGYWILRLFM